MVGQVVHVVTCNIHYLVLWTGVLLSGDCTWSVTNTAAAPLTPMRRALSHPSLPSISSSKWQSRAVFVNFLPLKIVCVAMYIV